MQIFVCVEDYLSECYDHGKNAKGYLVQGQFIKESLQDAEIFGCLLGVIFSLVVILPFFPQHNKGMGGQGCQQ